MKFNDITKKPIYCKACMEEIKTSPFRYLFERNPILCDKCISEIKKEMVVRKINGIKTLFLSKYDGIFKRWLMNYKEYSDIELAPCFLYIFLPYIRIYFLNDIFLPLPSSPSRIEKRGFSHLVEILKSSGLNYLDVFYTTEIVQQKEKKGSQRNKDKKISLLASAKELENKKVVLFDDVLTSGATFNQSLQALKDIHVKSIKGLILMDNQDHGKIG